MTEWTVLYNSRDILQSTIALTTVSVLCDDTPRYVTENILVFDESLVETAREWKFQNVVAFNDKDFPGEVPVNRCITHRTLLDIVLAGQFEHYNSPTFSKQEAKDFHLQLSADQLQNYLNWDGIIKMREGITKGKIIREYKADLAKKTMANGAFVNNTYIVNGRPEDLISLAQSHFGIQEAEFVCMWYPDYAAKSYVYTYYSRGDLSALEQVSKMCNIVDVTGDARYASGKILISADNCLGCPM